MEDELSFCIFLFLPWKKMFSVKISFVFHGRRTFLSHFLSSSMEDELSFFILLSSEPLDECSFLFSVNPMLQRRSFSCFFSMGLISNSHRVERSTNFLIMKKRKSCRRPRPCGGCCPACESIARQRQNLPSDCTQVALDSSRLKSTGGQGEKLNFATPRQESYKYYSEYCT